MADAESSSSSDDDTLERLSALFTEGDDLFLAVALEECQTKPRKKYVQHDFDKTHQMLQDHYLGPNPKYTEQQFQRRFQVTRRRYDAIKEAVLESEIGDGFFERRKDCCGRMGISTDAKLLCALSVLKTGETTDTFCAYYQLCATIGRYAVTFLCLILQESFGPKYLRYPNEDDIARLQSLHEEVHGFPGMIGSIDCMHVRWKNCPKAWQGTYQGKEKKPTLVLEAVADYNLWIWHCFFGLPGALNDINVVEASPLLVHLLKGSLTSKEYTINEETYTVPYFLADGIYPKWSCFVKTIATPSSAKQSHFAQRQEAARKDVERAFGVLQSKFKMLRRPVKLWSIGEIESCVHSCVILHNMAVEDRLDGYFDLSDSDSDSDSEESDAEQSNSNAMAAAPEQSNSNAMAAAPEQSVDAVDEAQPQAQSESEPAEATNFSHLSISERSTMIYNRTLHFALRANLIQHLGVGMESDSDDNDADSDEDQSNMSIDSA